MLLFSQWTSLSPKFFPGSRVHKCGTQTKVEAVCVLVGVSWLKVAEESEQSGKMLLKIHEEKTNQIFSNEIFTTRSVWRNWNWYRRRGKKIAEGLTP